ncbi:Peptidase C1 and/or Propeptide C1 domain containing protein, partial [Asbolus verrucosus]
MKGVFKIIRGKDECGIESSIFIGMPDRYCIFLTQNCVAQSDVLSDEFINAINEAQSEWRAGKVWPENATDEFLSGLNGSVNPNLYRHEYEDQIDHRPEFREQTNIPETFDLRKKYPHCESIGEPRNQGMCGSCWALAVASAFTDRICIENRMKFEVSAEDILTCCGILCLESSNHKPCQG